MVPFLSAFRWFFIFPYAILLLLFLFGLVRSISRFKQFKNSKNQTLKNYHLRVIFFDIALIATLGFGLMGMLSDQWQFALWSLYIFLGLAVVSVFLVKKTYQGVHEEAKLFVKEAKKQKQVTFGDFFTGKAYMKLMLHQGFWKATISTFIVNWLATFLVMLGWNYFSPFPASLKETVTFTFVVAFAVQVWTHHLFKKAMKK